MTEFLSVHTSRKHSPSCTLQCSSTHFDTLNTEVSRNFCMLKKSFNKVDELLMWKEVAYSNPTNTHTVSCECI